MLPKSKRTVCLLVIKYWLTNYEYQQVDDHNILAEEQKGYKTNHQGCKEQLVIYSIILKQVQTDSGNIFTAFVDYKKSFVSIPLSYFMYVLQLCNIPHI